MRHFIVTLEFLAPFETFGDAVARHRAFLQDSYDAGLLLISGPNAERNGGLVVARAESREAIEALFAADPYGIEGLARHAFTEFTPTKSQAFLAGWVA